jgi:2-polyprenyl-6-methoxyphenol hydroxylase-like FAD-dependent oxidoreductase
MKERKFGQAIIIGGSMAGLLSARAALDTFEKVTLIERDRLPDAPGPRKGLPQGRFIHILLARGAAILEGLFPGLDAELDEAGARRMDWAQDLRVFAGGAWAKPFSSGIYSRNASRDLLEGLLRRRLRAEPRLEFRQGMIASGLVLSPDGKRVSGVQVRQKGGDQSETILTADLVVDAAGRSSRTPDWLVELGFPIPEELVVNSYLGYATRWYQAPEGYSPDWTILMIRNQPPQFSRGAVISHVEGDQWIVGLSGVGGDYPPTEEAGFLEFARSLPDPSVYDFILQANPISPIYGYRRTENRLRRYERMSRWPEGFVAVGDSVSAFNPVYGQGMTVAAIGAETLKNCLKAARSLVGLSSRFQKQLAQANRTPWLLATGDDFRWPGTAGNRPGRGSRLAQRYVDALLMTVGQDRATRLAFLKVAQLVRPPTDLFQPFVMFRLLRWNLRRKSPRLGSGRKRDSLLKEVMPID